MRINDTNYEVPVEHDCGSFTLRPFCAVEAYAQDRMTAQPDSPCPSCWSTIVAACPNCAELLDDFGWCWQCQEVMDVP